jgi:alkanesulfonate monooxygenase SsuD/methylene tetrahydromethanopterin reductase-like flavin-dependent oxidoreductase (luciferase family)
MRYWYFNECAYPDLPPQETYESVRVTLPNRHLDPEVAAAWWDTYLAEYQAAAELGFDLMVNEHHSTATCMSSAIANSAAIQARTTAESRILLLGAPIANRSDPIRVAEETALLDVMSHGRLEVGFVRGVAYEVNGTNTWPMYMHERFWEAHDLIKLAWTSHDGPVNWQGRFFEHRQVNIWPRPLQQPHPPIWIATLSPSTAAKVGGYGYVAATFITGVEHTRNIFKGYREGWKSTHDDPMPLDRLAYLGLVYTADTDDEALAGAEKMLWYISSNKAPRQFIDPPGYRPAAVRAMEARKGSPLAVKGLSLEEYIDRGILFAGSPDSVVSQIERFREAVGGFGHLLMMGRSGFMTKEETIAGLERFARDVRPRLEGRFAEAAEAA